MFEEAKARLQKQKTMQNDGSYEEISMLEFT